MQSITSALLSAELQCEERILAPWNIRIDVYLVLWFGQMRETFATDWAQIHLWPGGQMHGPELAGAGRFGGANEFVGCAAKEVATRFILQRPSSGAILADTYLEAAASIAFIALAEYIAERVDR